MRQVMTILWDSYRLLKARILFWVVLAISLVVALLFASIGFHEHGYSFLFGLVNIDSELVNTESGYAELFYLVIFNNVVIKWWLGWLAIALAIISCCSIFPEALKQGAVDVAVSKPMSRVKFFVIKYIGSLLFVLLQVVSFCVIVFLALGLRFGHWNVSVFWAVPLLVFVFSMVYCFGVLVAVWSRSTMLSLLSMLLLWGGSWLIHITEDVMYGLSYGAEEAGLKVDMSTGQVSESSSGDHDGMKRWYDGIKVIAWIFPKTRDVTLMIGQNIKTDSSNRSLAGVSVFAFMDEDLLRGYQSREHQKAVSRHSRFYTIGSSLIFELLILILACWRFCKKDY